MTSPQPAGAAGAARPPSIIVLVAALALVAGCQGSTATPGPTASRSPVASASQPTQPASAQPPPTPSSTPGAAGGRWEAAGTMAMGRIDPHVILLGDGRVLVVGASPTWNPPGVEDARAELWDPASGAWHTTESLNSPRAEFAAVPLADGRALVTGGRNQADQSFSSTYLYDPRPGRETWSKVGLLGTARTAAAAAVLPDGRVLVAGGYFRVKPNFGSIAAPEAVLAADPPGSAPRAASSGAHLADLEPPNVGAALATAELFDPASGSWSATGPMKFARFGAVAVTLADGRVLVVGSDDEVSGVTVDHRAAGTAEIYDPATGRFSLTGGLPDIDRSALEEQGVPGANPVPEGDPWIEEVGSLVALDDGGAVLVAHAGWWKHVGEITRSLRFDARAGSWTEIGRTYVIVGEPTAVTLVTPGVRRLTGPMVARLPDGRVLVAGGAGPSELVVVPGGGTGYESFTSAAAELFDPATGAWSPLPPMPEARAGGAAVVLADGSVLVVGGYNHPPSMGDGSVLSSAVRFVPSP